MLSVAVIHAISAIVVMLMLCVPPALILPVRNVRTKTKRPVIYFAQQTKRGEKPA